MTYAETPTWQYYRSALACDALLQVGYFLSQEYRANLEMIQNRNEGKRDVLSQDNLLMLSHIHQEML